MKVMFEFDLPDEQYEYKRYLQSDNVMSFLEDFSEFLRRKDKYSEEETTTWEAVREKFYEMITENNVDLN